MKLPILSLFSIVSLTSCGTMINTPKAPESADIHGLVFVNQSQSDATNLKLRVANTRSIISANRVLPNRSFATSFPARSYQGNPIKLTWVQDGAKQSTSDLVFSLPRKIYQNEPVTAYLIIQPNHTVRALIK